MKKLFVALLIVVGLCFTAQAQEIMAPEVIAQNIAIDCFTLYSQVIFPNVDATDKAQQEPVRELFNIYFGRLAELGVVTQYMITVDFDREIYYIDIMFLVVGEDAKWSMIRMDKTKLPQFQDEVEEEKEYKGPKIPKGKRVYASREMVHSS